MNLDQFINKDLKSDDVLHSNGMGSVAGGGGAGGISLEERRRRMRNENKTIRGYHWSQLGASRSTLKARTAEESLKFQLGNERETGSDSFGRNRQSSAMESRQESAMRAVERSQHVIKPTPRNFGNFG